MRSLVKSLVLPLAWVAAANAWSADGRILDVVGDVRVNGKPATAETVVYQNDTIVTAPGASVRIVLSDNSILDLDSDAQIRLSDYNYNPAAPKESKSDISVVEGTLRYVSGLIAKENPDKIGFTAGDSTIGVRGTFTGIEVEDNAVNVEAMIGTATVTRQSNTVVVPPGQAARTDPETGMTLVETSTSQDKVNEVVRAIAALSPDASNRVATDEGCSAGIYPVRAVARPETDAEASSAIDSQLAALSEGELMMVMAVLINNARHLCIDSSTVSSTLAKIASVRPESVKEVLEVAVLLDPDNKEEFNESATPPPPGGPTNPPPISDPRIIEELPPGGGIGDPPSPE